jgi:predicted AAA+ superfamily ATPase
MEQLFNEDLRDLTRIQDTGQIQVLAELIQHEAGQPVNYSTLAVNTNISVDTARRWIRVLENIYYCFSVRPWFRNSHSGTGTCVNFFISARLIRKIPPTRHIHTIRQ